MASLYRRSRIILNSREDPIWMTETERSRRKPYVTIHLDFREARDRFRRTRKTRRKSKTFARRVKPINVIFKHCAGTVIATNVFVKHSVVVRVTRITRKIYSMSIINDYLVHLV